MALGGGVFVQLRARVFFVKQALEIILQIMWVLFLIFICYLSHATFQV